MIYFGVKEGKAYQKYKLLNLEDNILLNSTNNTNSKIPISTLIKENLIKIKDFLFLFGNLLTSSSIEDTINEIGLKKQLENVKNYLIQFRFTTINFLKFFVFFVFVILNELTYDYSQKKKQINKTNNQNNKSVQNNQLDKEKKD
jgi:hypothetical protein